MIDREYDAQIQGTKPEYLEKAIRRMDQYQKQYQKIDESDAEKINNGDRVWYAETKKESGKLSPTWKTKAIVIGQAVNSYRLRDEKGNEWIANQRFVKKRKF